MFYISLLLEDNFLMNYVFRIVTSNVPVHGILFVPPTGIFHEDKEGYFKFCVSHANLKEIFKY